MGYTSRYDGTQRVQLEGDEDYWVDVRKCLTGQQMNQARTNLVGFRVVENDLGAGQTEFAAVIDKIDPTGFAREVALMSIVAWNLDDGDGEIIPWPAATPESTREDDVVRRTSYGLLTEAHQDQIEGVVVRLDQKPTREEETRFPDGGEGSAPLGAVSSPDDREVLERA